MDVKFYSLGTLPSANTGAAGSFVHVTSGDNAGMWYCTGSAMIRLDNVAQDKAGEVKSATVDTATGVASFKNASGTEVFTLNLADYLAAEIAKLTGSATIASVADGVVTIKTGVSEANGKIENAVGTDIVLAKVATTGKAVDILLDPSADLGTDSYTTVQAAIAALAAAFNGLVSNTEDAIKTHAEDATIHITDDERTAWNAKADATTVAALDKYVKGDADASTDAAKKGLEGRIADLEGADVQNALTTEQLAAVNSGVTKDKVDGYDAHLTDTTVHITNEERTAWNAKQNALSAEDLARIAAVDSKANSAELGTAAKKDAATDAIVAESTDTNLVSASQVATFVKSQIADLAGAMHFVPGTRATITDPKAGDICLEGTKEYVYDGSAWLELGDEGAWDPKDAAKNVQGNTTETVASVDTKVTTHTGNGDIHVTAEQKTEWSGKQDKLVNADVLAGITDAQVEAWDDAADANHSHENKELLDTYTQTEANLADAVSKKHSHTNATVLDGITSEKVTAWDAAATAKHTHDNATVLDGITAEKVAAWDAKQDAIAENTYDAYGAADAVKTEVIGTSTDAKTADTVNGAKAYADDAVKNLADTRLVWLTEWPTA